MQKIPANINKNPNVHPMQGNVLNSKMVCNFNFSLLFSKFSYLSL